MPKPILLRGGRGRQPGVKTLGLPRVDSTGRVGGIAGAGGQGQHWFLEEGGQ